MAYKKLSLVLTDLAIVTDIRVHIKIKVINKQITELGDSNCGSPIRVVVVMHLPAPKVDVAIARHRMPGKLEQEAVRYFAIVSERAGAEIYRSSR